MYPDTCLENPENDTYTQDDCPDYVGKKVKETGFKEKKTSVKSILLLQISLAFYAIYIIVLVILAVNLMIAIFK